MDSNRKRAVIKFFKRPRYLVMSVLLIVVLVGLVISAYYLFIYGGFCEDETCFLEKTVQCKKIKYLDSTPETLKQYEILGKKNGMCEIKVEILQIRQGSVELASIEGKSMICSIPIGTYTEPESNIKNCHGLLKEEIQETIIQRMHSQIVENIGKIGEELTDII